MNSPEKDKGAGALERIKEFASNVGEALHMPSKNQILAVGAATVAAFGASEISQNSQAEARTPVDPTNDMAMSGTVTVKETITKKNGDKDVVISRKKFDEFPDDDSPAPSNLFTAMNGPTKPVTTVYKPTKTNPLGVKFILPDAYGCGVPANAQIPFSYRGRSIYRIPGRPTYAKQFGKAPIKVRSQFEALYTTGDEEKNKQIRDAAPNGVDPLWKIQKLKTVKVKPNRTSARKFKIATDCYPISEATDPSYEPFKAAGYEFTPVAFRVEYIGNIARKVRGLKYEAEMRGDFNLWHIRAMSPEVYNATNK